MADDAPPHDRRTPPVAALHQPVEPATMRAVLGGRDVVEHGDVVHLTDRTVVVEVRDAAVALAFSLATEVAVVLHLGGGQRTLLAEPGRRVSDNPTSRRVELVLRRQDDT